MVDNQSWPSFSREFSGDSLYFIYYVKEKEKTSFIVCIISIFVCFVFNFLIQFILFLCFASITKLKFRSYIVILKYLFEIFRKTYTIFHNLFEFTKNFSTSLKMLQVALKRRWFLKLLKNLLEVFVALDLYIDSLYISLNYVGN